MPRTELPPSKGFFQKCYVERQTLFSDIWLSKHPRTLSYLQYFALRIIVSLTSFLMLPMVLFNAEPIEIIIAVFSVEASSTALIFSKIKTKSTTAWLLSYIEDEIIEFTNAVGVAGTGALVVIYLLT
ncbi:MAG: hypothetical protein HLUCCA13_08835 [Halomonas sp. HL-48]|nr:hypothetical protein [Halomonas sp. HL-48]KPQ24612.1 MAG: hypothetical protein HLUCCA13_08835 [Halomonas sp. HL-48]